MIFVTKTPEIRQRAADYILALTTVQDIRILKPNRTRSQNDYFWTIASILGDFYGYTKDGIKDMLMVRLGFADEKEIDGKIYTIVRTTTTLNKEEFGRLIDACFVMAQQAGLVLPIAREQGVY